MLYGVDFRRLCGFDSGGVPENFPRSLKGCAYQNVSNPSRTIDAFSYPNCNRFHRNENWYWDWGAKGYVCNWRQYRAVYALICKWRCP